MKSLATLLEQNRDWSRGKLASDSHFFSRLCEIQRPDYLWIGCADSRVPANEIVGLAPGELFVHRNVANIVEPGDTNCMAVVQYAVEVLDIRRIIVCGHYGCGGVRAVLDETQAVLLGHLERWLAPLKHLANVSAAELSGLETIDARAARLCEINVIEQVRRLEASDVLRNIRLRGLDIALHGLIYNLADGLLREL